MLTGNAETALLDLAMVDLNLTARSRPNSQSLTATAHAAGGPGRDGALRRPRRVQRSNVGRDSRVLLAFVPPAERGPGRRSAPPYLWWSPDLLHCELVIGQVSRATRELKERAINARQTRSDAATLASMTAVNPHSPIPGNTYRRALI